MTTAAVPPSGPQTAAARTRPEPDRPRFRRCRYLLLGATAVLGSVLIGLPRHSPFSVLCVALATAAGAAVAILERRDPIGPRPIVAVIGLIFVVAVAVGPRTSNDIWSYTIYGRMVSAHGESPYEKLPVDFKSDPYFRRVSPTWRHRGSVYGPVFVGFAAAGTAITGDSPLLTRWFFQLTAALAAAAVLWLVWRRTKSSAALAWLGLHPLLGPIVVNGGHNDIFVGLAILGAAMLCQKRRGWLAGLIIGIAALVKLTTVLALAGIILWAWRHRDRRLAITASVATGATLAIGYLPFVSGASHVLTGADKTVTPGSAWNPLAAALLGHDAWRRVPNPLAPNDTLIALWYASLVLVAILVVTVGWRTARARSIESTVGATTASYTVAAEYSYPWYAAWALPVVAEHRPTPLAWVIWAQAVVMLAALKLPIIPRHEVVDTVLRGTITYAAPLLILVAFVVAGTRYPWGRSSPEP